MGTCHSGTNLTHPFYYPWFLVIDRCWIWAPTHDVTMNILFQPVNGHRDILSWAHTWERNYLAVQYMRGHLY